jgi:hypothetical protein
MLLYLFIIALSFVEQVEVKSMTIMDEPRVTHKFLCKLECVLEKLVAKSLPVSDALRRAHSAMMKKARELFIVPTFDSNDPGDVNK